MERNPFGKAACRVEGGPRRDGAPASKQLLLKERLKGLPHSRHYSVQEDPQLKQLNLILALATGLAGGAVSRYLWPQTVQAQS
jgi:hypothetical protein